YLISIREAMGQHPLRQRRSRRRLDIVPPEASLMGHLEWSRASFLGSLVPMVVADDDRRFVAANPAACLLLRLAEADVIRLRVDDLTPPENRLHMDALWESFLRDG